MRQEQSKDRNPNSSVRNFNAEAQRLLRHSIKAHGKKNLQRFAAKTRSKSLGQPIPNSIRSASVGRGFDICPRVLLPGKWKVLSRGIEQRTRAIDAFLDDLHGMGNVVRRGILNERIAYECIYSPTLGGVSPPGGGYSVLASVDLAVGGNGMFYCVEKGNPSAQDIANLRANRIAMRTTFPEIFAETRIASTEAFWINYRSALLRAANSDHMSSCIAVAADFPSIEIDFIADRIAATPAIWSDFRISRGKIALKTTDGLKPVKVICHFGDSVPDPLFSGDPNLAGTAGILSVFRAAGVIIANAPDAGVAENNKIHAKLPDLIKFYLGEEPVLENWPCWQGDNERERNWMLDNLDRLEILKASGFGGRAAFEGIETGNEEIGEIRDIVRASPDDFIARLPVAETSLADFKGYANPKGFERLTLFAMRSDDGFAAVEGGVSETAAYRGQAEFTGTSRFRDVWILKGDDGAVSAC
ncbi:MAG: circularly permuted type 2 ATP-grasp protein [Albidovulum sp.]|nr:circularly permuted type 2 ATP-grasp protein [Albidovulum sp.]MDE0532198.1 circularly permuted type 2 ATP-grasp protein [Albidovulum sp.]